MTPTTLTGEYHMSEVQTETTYPLSYPWTVWVLRDGPLREAFWPSTIAYAERHSTMTNR